MEEKKIKLIDKFTVTDLRRAYFDKKLPEFLAQVQAIDTINVEVMEEIKTWLAKFRLEDENIINEMQSIVPNIIKREDGVPNADELFRPLTGEEQINLKRWFDKIDVDMKQCVALAKEQKERIAKGQRVDVRNFLDIGLFYTTSELDFNRCLIYRERLYKKKIIEIIDDFGTTRREAQDRAEITKEYFEFKVMQKNLETLRELSLMAKKYQPNNF